MSKKEVVCAVTPEQLDSYDCLIALDIDGVFADTWLNHIRYDHPGIMDPRITKFIEENKEMLEKRDIKPHDVKGIQFESLAFLASVAALTNSGFVVVSSWVSTPETYKGVELIFKLMNVDYKDFVVGQTTGGGGYYREEGFFNWVRQYCDKDKPKKLIAIDDSGYRHFPVMHQTHNLVQTLGRIGYNMDDMIRTIRRLDFKDEDWYDWADKGYIKNAETPIFTKEQFWNLMWDGSIRGLCDTHWSPDKRGDWLWKLKRFLYLKKGASTWLLRVIQKWTLRKKKVGK